MHIPNAVHESHSYQTLRAKGRIDEMPQAASATRNYSLMLLLLYQHLVKMSRHTRWNYSIICSQGQNIPKKYYLFEETACIMVVISPWRETVL